MLSLHVSSQVTGEGGEVSICNKGRIETDIVGCVAMIVHATEECRCCIFANIFEKKRFTSRVVTHETFQIVDESSDAQEWT